MLKRINIKSILQAKDSLNDVAFKEFLNHFGIEIRDAEIEDLRCLSLALTDAGCGIREFDGHFVGYKIPQIGKEFDLLRLGPKFLVNIELKSDSTEEKIEKQLKRNKYYLSFLSLKVYAFTFVSASKELYLLQDDGQLKKVEIDLLRKLLSTQGVDESDDLDTLFNPSDYLVSPFNSTKKFLAEEYFLTSHQENVKTSIVESLMQPKVARFISIIGGAGTGKTLLTYDIAKSLSDGNKKMIIIHCGQLNNGHQKLIDNGWNIVPIKNYSSLTWSNFELVIVDEAQRIRKNQLDDIIEKAKASKCCCIFSHDKRQTLANEEAKRDMSAKITSIPSIKQFKLSDKIRTNKEIATFIKMLFNSKRSLPISSNGNIEVNYFNSINNAREYVENLDRNKWDVLRFTPSQHNDEFHKKYSNTFSSTSHAVIGQEFDGVVVTIDKFFSYDVNGDLIYKGGAYYDPPKMLFQNISRCRKKLNLVIIANAELLGRCIAILR